MSDTPRTNDIQYGIEKRSHLRGFVVPDDVFDMMELARQLERELAAKAEECERLRREMQHWREYWNGNENERAMADALHHIMDGIDAALREAK